MMSWIYDLVISISRREEGNEAIWTHDEREYGSMSARAITSGLIDHTGANASSISPHTSHMPIISTAIQHQRLQQPPCQRQQPSQHAGELRHTRTHAAAHRLQHPLDIAQRAGSECFVVFRSNVIVPFWRVFPPTVEIWERIECCNMPEFSLTWCAHHSISWTGWYFICILKKWCFFHSTEIIKLPCCMAMRLETEIIKRCLKSRFVTYNVPMKVCFYFIRWPNYPPSWKVGPTFNAIWFCFWDCVKLYLLDKKV